MISLLRLPFDHNSSYLRGAAEGPDRICQKLFHGGSNLWSEGGLDLSSRLEVLDPPADFAEVEKTAAAHLEQGKRLLSLGGDHSLSRALVAAHARRHPGLVVIQFDAHPDLYPEYDGNLDSHASPFARLLIDGTITSLVQVGIRTQNDVQAKIAEKYRVTQIPMWEVPESLELEFEGPIYLSVDLDVLDPAYAPGVSHHEPAGMSTRHLVELVKGLPRPVGADIVEYNPVTDHADMTCSVAVKLVKEIAARML